MRSELWFEKVLWGYMPSHWKGWAIVAAFALSTIVGSLLGQSILNRLGHLEAGWVPFVALFIPAFVSLLAIAKRHS